MVSELNLPVACHGFLCVCGRGCVRVVLRVKQWLWIGVSQSKEWQQEISAFRCTFEFSNMSSILSKDKRVSFGADSLPSADYHLFGLTLTPFEWIRSTVTGFCGLAALRSHSRWMFLRLSKKKKNVYICICCMLLFIG